MIDWLLQIDTGLFYLINKTLAHESMDGFFLVLTNLHNVWWVKFAVLPVLVVLWVGLSGKKAFKTFLAVAVTVALTDMISYRVLKSAFDRTRPNQSQTIDSTLRLPHSPKSKSFPSNHSVNSFAAATMASHFYPPARFYLYALVAAIGYSRVYVGVHFPTDVIAGALIGWIAAKLLVWLGQICARSWQRYRN